MPEPFRPDLENLPDGWFNHGDRVLALIEEHRPHVIVELGTWLGTSAIAMARSVRRWGGIVTCIDTWAGSVAYHGTIGPPLMIMACAKYIVQAGVGASVRLIPATTHDAAAQWRGPEIDLLYIDADHSYAGTMGDLKAWAPHVRRGGLLIGDDYGHPQNPGVKEAWDEFERMRGLSLVRYQSTPPHPDGLELVYGTI